MRFSALLGLAAVLLSGCGAPDPADACVDLAETIADKADECGLDYQASYQATIDVFVGGDCEETRGLMYDKAFYRKCLPALSAISCEELRKSGIQFPESCSLTKGQ